MKKIIELITLRFQSFTFVDVIDILLLGALFFGIYKFIRKRRTFPILIGALLIAGIRSVSYLLGFSAMYNVINAFFVPGMIVVAIIFHEDIRAFLEKIGALAISLVKIITGKMKMVSGNQETEAITKAVMRLSATKTGALIVLEKNTGVEDICQSGIKINALISHELICNLFFAPAPLHDGAIIIRGKRINSAGCFLPNYSEPGLNSSFGSRHRAAIGMSRLSDAGIIVVSEEDGKISYAYAGELFRGIDAETLREIVEKYYGVSQKHKKEGKDLNESNE